MFGGHNQTQRHLCKKLHAIRQQRHYSNSRQQETLHTALEQWNILHTSGCYAKFNTNDSKQAGTAVMFYDRVQEAFVSNLGPDTGNPDLDLSGKIFF
jgi:hypothetical protein